MGSGCHQKGEAVAFDSHKRKKRAHDHTQIGFSFSDANSPKGVGKGVSLKSRAISRLERADDGFVPNAHKAHAHAMHDFAHDAPDHAHVPNTLSGKVLILNGNYEPLAVCSVQKAIILMYLDKAEMVSSIDGKLVHSSSSAIPFPSVIRLSNYVRVPFKKVILSRKNILRRDNHRCQYCGASSISLTVDHILPKSRGGEDSWENLVSACLRCNNRKGSHTPDEAEMPLLRRPIRPNHVTFLRQYVGNVDKGWEPYLFMH